MDGLYYLFRKAEEVGLLLELAPLGFVILVKSDILSHKASAAIVEDFGVASGLCTYFAKCSTRIPIRCSRDQIGMV